MQNLQETKKTLIGERRSNQTFNRHSFLFPSLLLLFYISKWSVMSKHTYGDKWCLCFVLISKRPLIIGLLLTFPVDMFCAKSYIKNILNK